MIDALSYQYDLTTDLSLPRLLVVGTALVVAYRLERRAWLRIITTAFFLSQIADAALIGLALRSGDVLIWWPIFGGIPYVAVRPELRRLVLSIPGRVTTILPRLVAAIREPRNTPDGIKKNRQALKLLRDEGWRPGWVRHSLTDAGGQTHTVWAPPQRLPFGVRMHGWLAFLPTAALAAVVVWLIWQLPPWARPIAEVGVGVGVLSHFHLLPNPLRLLGL